MTDAEMYNKAADIIEKGWTRKVAARNELGYSVHPTAGDATSWCLSGALTVVSRIAEGFDLYESNFIGLIRNLGLSEHATKWNDDPNRTQKDVVELLRETAKRTEVQEVN